MSLHMFPDMFTGHTGRTTIITGEKCPLVVLYMRHPYLWIPALFFCMAQPLAFSRIHDGVMEFGLL